MSTKDTSIDYTDDCLRILNRVIEFSAFMPIYTSDHIASHMPRLFSAIGNRTGQVVRVHDGPPREVYEAAFDDDPDVVKSVELKWATTWAKNAGIIGHHGPAGTSGWVLYRPTKISKIELGLISPFNVQVLSDALSEAMRFSNALRTQEIRKQQDALSRATKIENQLKAEKKKQTLSKQFTWS